MTITRLAILGSTGSIGRQALEVAERHPERVRVVALAAGRDLEQLIRQAKRWRPELVALERPADPAAARAALGEASPGTRVAIGAGAARTIAAEAEADVILNGIVGAAGLGPSLAAIGAGRRLALANKETLVIGGPLVRAALAARPEAELVPVDSEHSGAFQCLAGRSAAGVARLVLTASGGPLLGDSGWRDARPDRVLAHPVWSMGPRITVDSALLFNKGLELIEAHWLFGLEWERLEAVIHPQARIHAWVELVDGSVIAQAAPADMRLPIQLALSWPQRWSAPSDAPRLDWSQLEFRPIEPGAHPAFDLAVAAGRAGGTAPCALNAADEVAVEGYLEGAFPLGHVPQILEAVMEAHRVEPVESLEQLERVDAWAREQARQRAVRV